MFVYKTTNGIGSRLSVYNVDAPVFELESAIKYPQALRCFGNTVSNLQMKVTPRYLCLCS